jgi:hypothetical protein
MILEAAMAQRRCAKDKVSTAELPVLLELECLLHIPSSSTFPGKFKGVHGTGPAATPKYRAMTKDTCVKASHSEIPFQTAISVLGAPFPVRQFNSWVGLEHMHPDGGFYTRFPYKLSCAISKLEKPKPEGALLYKCRIACGSSCRGVPVSKRDDSDGNPSPNFLPRQANGYVDGNPTPKLKT